jgi:hypothetical protein
MDASECEEFARSVRYDKHLAAIALTERESGLGGAVQASWAGRTQRYGAKPFFAARTDSTTSRIASITTWG